MDKAIKEKKPWYKKVWVWVVIIIVIVGIGGGAGSQSDTDDKTANTADSSNEKLDTPKEEKKTDLATAYGKVKNGMTKAQVKKTLGMDAESCTESEDPTFGKTELCTYGNVFIDKMAVTVTYQQDVVSSKSKSTY